MDVEFCECGGMFVPAGNKMKCRSCGKETGKKMDVKRTESKNRKDIVIFENNEPDLPKTDKECPECGHKDAYFWLIQTRSSDEPPTQFFRCTKCRHVWREYK